VSSARRSIETSKQIGNLPATAAAVRSGSLSAAKVAAIAGAATIAPEAEAQLLDGAAAKPLAALREDCLRARAVDRDAAHKRIRSERYAKEFTDAEGAWNFRARGTVEDGAKFRAAYGPIVDEQFKTARKEGRTESYEAYAFDALIELARRATDTAQPEGKKAKQPPASSSDSSESTSRPRTRHRRRRRDLRDRRPRTHPVDTARDLLVTRSSNSSSPRCRRPQRHPPRTLSHRRQNVALWWQSPACRVLGCCQTRRLQIDTGKTGPNLRTVLENLDPLCKHHHDLKTYDNWALIEGTATAPWSTVRSRHPKHPTTTK